MQELSIWSQVVLAQLNCPRRVKQESVHILEPGFNIFEDLKVKIKEASWKRQGRAVEALLNLELLFLLEDRKGNIKLLSQDTTLRDRVPLLEFDGNMDLLEKDKMIGFKGDIKGLSWQMDINEQEVKVFLSLEYLLLATREQVVRLSELSETGVESEDMSEKIDELKSEIARAQNEKHSLQQQVLLYEKDISSLKRGIRKVENRNSLLNKESKQYQEMLAQLQLAIQEQDGQLNRREHAVYQQAESARYLPLAQMGKEVNNSELSLGKRVKRLFMNSI